MAEQESRQQKTERMLAEFEEERRRIFLSQSAIYGPATFGHGNVGLIWTAQLQQYYGIELDEPVPSKLVLLMMAGSKLNRASGPNYRGDSFADGSFYFDLAHIAILEEKETQ